MLSEVSTISNCGRDQLIGKLDSGRLTLSLERYRDEVLQDEGIRQTDRVTDVCER